MLQTSELLPRFLERLKTGISVLPQGEERQVRLAGVGAIARRCQGAGEAEVRQRIQWGVGQFSSMIDDAAELVRGFGAVRQLQLCLTSQVRRPEFRDRRMIERPHRLEQLQGARWLPVPDRCRRGNHRKNHVRGEDGVRKASCQFA